MEEDREVLVCPVCYSLKIDLYLGGYAGKIYRCLDCGYTGALILKMTLKDYLKLLEERGGKKGEEE